MSSSEEMPLKQTRRENHTEQQQVSPVDEARFALLQELHRCRFAKTIRDNLEQAFRDEATKLFSSSPASSAAATMDDEGLFVAYVFESASETSKLTPSELLSRTSLHKMVDIGAAVAPRPEATEEEGWTDSLRALAADGNVTLSGVVYDRGSVMAEVNVAEGDEGLMHTERVAMSSCNALKSIPNFPDPALPCGELIGQHGAPKSVYNLSLSKFCELDNNGSKGNMRGRGRGGRGGAGGAPAVAYNQKKKAAWRVADAAVVVARQQRQEFAELQKHLEPSVNGVKVTKTVRVGDVTLQVQNGILDEGSFSLIPERYARLCELSKRARRGTESAASDEELDVRIATLLVRYLWTLTGMRPRDEDGWQAAVPPPAFKVLQDAPLTVGAECFASPLNCTLDRFCSAFLDTDRYFGSLGSFFAYEFAKNGGSFEANPPFDHEVMRTMFAKMLADCTVAVQPLSFLIVIPESTRDNGLAVRAEADGSMLTRHSSVVAAADSPYAHGYQHEMGSETVFVNSCDTRVMLIQSDSAATKLLQDAQQASEGVAFEVTLQRIVDRFTEAWKNSLTA